MSSFGHALIQAARPKTLTASLVPVLVGSSLAYQMTHQFRIDLFFLILLSAGFIQIGTNLFNDAIDYLKGADTSERLGPARATQMGWLKPRQVLSLACLSFLLALGFGVPLVIQGGLPILAIGLVSLLMGYCYTGGPYPLAYKGLGDIFVIIFFGWIAVGGTYYLLSESYNWSAFIAGTQVGFLGTVLIAINNLRDQKLDEKVGKRTLSVRLGALAHWEITFLIAGTFLLNIYWLQVGLWKVALFPFVLLPFALRLDRMVKETAAGPIYNVYLAKAAKMQLGFGALMAVGFCLS